MLKDKEEQLSESELLLSTSPTHLPAFSQSNIIIGIKSFLTPRSAHCLNWVTEGVVGLFSTSSNPAGGGGGEVGGVDRLYRYLDEATTTAAAVSQ